MKKLLIRQTSEKKLTAFLDGKELRADVFEIGTKLATAELHYENIQGATVAALHYNITKNR